MLRRRSSARRARRLLIHVRRQAISHDHTVHNVGIDQFQQRILSPVFRWPFCPTARIPSSLDATMYYSIKILAPCRAWLRTVPKRDDRSNRVKREHSRQTVGAAWVALRPTTINRFRQATLYPAQKGAIMSDPAKKSPLAIFRSIAIEANSPIRPPIKTFLLSALGSTGRVA